MSKSKRLFDISLLVVLGVAVFGSTIHIVGSRSEQSFFDPLIDVKRIISRAYVDAVDSDALRDRAISGMLEALNDPYSVFVPASDAANFAKSLTGEYVGIGAQVTQLQGWLTIVTPLEDSPALRAGMLPDDRVVEIEGKSTFGLTIDQCIELLMGRPGTNVNLVVERKEERVPMVITRDHIKSRMVKGFHRDPADPEKWQFLIDPDRRIAYVRLVQFTPGCAKEVRDALVASGATRNELRGLILDLRYNGGGLLGEAIQIADFFLDSGVVVSTRGRTVPEQVTRATRDGTLEPFPIAVLLNGHSASASEVLAGALIDNDRAIVVGTRSFGKGSVQSVHSLPHAQGAQLKITEQRYYLPSGRSIQATDDSAVWGVDPTPGFYIPISDAQELAMLTARREQELILAGRVVDPSEQWSDPEWIVERLKDPQLAAAVRALQAKVDSGEWTPPSSEPGEARTVAYGELRRARDTRERMLRELARLDRRIEAIEASRPAGAEVVDLWPDSADVTGGVLRVYDKDGNVVATLALPEGDAERRLIDAGLRPAK